MAKHLSIYHANDICCSLNVIKHLIEKGANSNITTTSGDTSLHYACLQNNKDIIAFLISKGLNPNLKNKNGETPYLIACKCCSLDTLKHLIEKGATTNDTSIPYACLQNDKDIISFLISKGLNLNTKNKNGETTKLSF